MKTKTKTPKADDGSTRTAMRALSKRPLADLRTDYLHAFGKGAGGMKRDALIKSLAATIEAEQPEPAHPAWEEQAVAKSPAAPAARRIAARDPRLPAPGTVIEREYKGKAYRVEVLARGFKHDGKEWRSLTAIALAVTGYKAISGTLFFGIAKRREAPATTAPAAAKPAPKAKAAKAPRSAKAKTAKKAAR